MIIIGIFRKDYYRHGAAGPEGKPAMHFIQETAKKVNTGATIALLLLGIWGLYHGIGQQAHGAPAYQINGYYLGATPEQLGITLETDPFQDEKYYEVESNGVRLFFIRVESTVRTYRIIKEEAVSQGSNIKTIQDSLKARYGTPDKQQIKTSSIKSNTSMTFSTMVKNKAIWNISATQEFIAEIESNRVVFELIDHAPEKSRPTKKTDAFEEEEFTGENWDPDY